MSPAVAAIEGLRKLPANWNSYGATAPDDPTVVRALAYLMEVVRALGPAYGEPEVQPIPDPGVALIWRDRWHPEEVEVLVTPTGAEWVLLKEHRIVDHGKALDPTGFSRNILKRHVSL